MAARCCVRLLICVLNKVYRTRPAWTYQKQQFNDDKFFSLFSLFFLVQKYQGVK